MDKHIVDITSYDTFRKATFGKLYDVDGVYGGQCVDAAKLLWVNLPPSYGKRQLTTGGTGAARGCWEVVSARTINAGTEFELIADVTKIKRGDVIVFGTKIGSYGHIGFADEDYPTSKSTTIACYSQNQGNSNGVGNAAAFGVKGCNKAALIGAFRYKAWSSAGAGKGDNPARLKGDVNGDGKVDMSDALEILKYLAGIDGMLKPGTDAWNAALIVDPNASAPTVMDALEIQKKIAGIPNVIDGSSTKQPVYYTVVKGDTMGGIAKKFGITLDALAAANPQVVDVNRISVGDVLSIP